MLFCLVPYLNYQHYLFHMSQSCLFFLSQHSLPLQLNNLICTFKVAFITAFLKIHQFFTVQYLQIMIQQQSSNANIEKEIPQPKVPTILGALLTKNILIVYDNLSKYLLIYISPVLILLLIQLLQMWANSNFIWEKLNPPTLEIPMIPKCFGENCTTLAYLVNGKDQPYIQHTISYVKNANNLSDNDVKKWNMTLIQAMKKLQVNPNKTQAVVAFCTQGYWEIQDFKIPCYGDEYHLNSYTIIFNLSLFHRVPFFSDLQSAYPKDMSTIKLKKDLDEGIISFYNSEAKINISSRDFPSKNSRFITGFSIFAQYGSFFIMIPYLIVMVMQGSNKLKQKQDRLRIGLNIVGVSHFQFYFTELLTYFIHTLIISFFFCLGGYILDIKFWSNALIWFDYVTLVINGFTLGIVSFCITAIVSNKNLGMSLLYGFVLYSIVMQWLFSGGYILQLLYMDTASTFVKVLKFIFNLYPSYHFTKIFADISRTADSHFDTLQNRYVQGRRFTYEDLSYRRTQTFQKPFPRSYTLPNCFQSLAYMSLVTILYFFILFILDRYVESNRGYKERLCPQLRRRKKSVYREISQQNEEESLVSIVNLQKIYKNNVHALRGVSVQLNKGDIVSLLGQNGAGKSTLINILIGVLSYSRGQVLVKGMNIQNERTQIRKIIGVCPQFDILWEELTAEQHVKMFCQLKGVDSNNQNIRRCLESVQLYKNKDGKVKTFSGGMRRRLSLAISLIGNPKLVVLDEPTTGMDAKIRLQTWKIILKLRDRKRTMLITTHNMEQAECLSDRIMIMSKGRIVAQGTTVQLKKQFGEGYVIEGQKAETGEKVKLKFKESELEQEIQKIINEKLEHWSLQQTTLEQVFLNVSNRY